MKRTAVLISAGVLFAAGCTSPEDSPWFTADWQRELDAAQDNPVTLPEGPSVQPSDDADWLDVKLASDGPVLLSVEDAVVLAMRRNRDLTVQTFSPVIAGTFERIERGVFDPVAFAEFEYGEETASEIDRGTGTRFNVEDRTTAAAAGITQDLPTGTAVEMSVEQNRDTSNRTPEQQDARLGLTVTQQLLRGAGPAVNLVSIRQAQLDAEASRYELQGFAEALLAEVESAYWRYALAQENTAIFTESRDLSRRQRDEVDERIKIGVLAEADAAVAYAEVALREQALINARSDEADQRLRLLRLLNLTGDEAHGWSQPITVTSPPAVEALPIDDLADRQQLAEQSRPDLAEARLRLEQDRLETIVTRNGVLPQLELFMAIGKTGFADRFDDSFQELEGDSYDLAAGIRFSKLLGNDAALARRDAAYASRAQSAAAIDNLRQLIALDLQLAANELERARQQIQASATTRAMQEKVVAAERERFEAGDSTALLVAQAQRDLLEAQINEVAAVIAYRLGLIDLYLAEGTLLQRRGFSVSPSPPPR
ncbi:MAG: TolC family protein [Planctomycetota bacterium]